MSESAPASEHEQAKAPPPRVMGTLARVWARILREIPAGHALCAECWQHVPLAAVADGRSPCCGAAAVPSTQTEPPEGTTA